MKRRPIYHLLFLAGLLITVITSCKHDEPSNPENPFNGRTTAVFNPDKEYGTVTDIDGNEYKTIVIGTQTWMAENLRTTHYRNGEPIKYVDNRENWITILLGAYCNYGDTIGTKEIATMGRLYNWYAVSDPRNIAPCGWHISTAEEWAILTNYLGSENIAGGKMKEKGVLHWIAKNVEANNESGFTALPCGYRDYYSGTFNSIGSGAFWWSSTEDDNSHSWYRYLNNQLSSIGRFSYYIGNKNTGFSVRCIKD